MEGTAWIRRLRPRSAAAASRRLVCFPHAGGSASYFAPLAQALPDAVDLVALQYPARQERLSEPGIASIDELVAAILPQLDGWLDQPFALFGHSMGAIVAYEVARILEHQRGTVPLALVVSGRRAPSTWRDEHVHRGGDRALVREVVRLGGTPSQLLDDEDVHQMMLPALRSDYRAIETYEWQPGPPLSCPIWAVLGETDPLTTQVEAQRWAAQTTAHFELRTFRGGHFYLVAHLPELAELLVRSLADRASREDRQDREDREDPSRRPQH